MDEIRHGSLGFVRGTVALLAAALALLGAASARAQDEDPPGRAARLAYLQGAVSFEPAGASDWVVPPVNQPLTTGDQLWVDQDGRAELQLDGSALRVGAGTAFSFLNLADHVTQIQLSSGTLLVHVRRLDDGETYEIDTPNLAFTVQQPGVYRLSVDPQGGTTAIAVRRGQGEATGGGTAYDLYQGEYDTFAGSDQLIETSQSYDYAPDDLDAWADAREARWSRSLSARYVAPDVVGYEDLDDQGTWTPTPQYGYVWVPSGVDPGWAPYTVGHWAYVAPWGYTWVDDRPWGFAPFHYGRWVWTGVAWGWVPAPPPAPGVVYVRPVYAPALVAWVGVGAGVAWFALGPREVFIPSYPVSRAYVNNINISNTTVNTTTITNVYNTTIVNKTVNVTTINYVNRTAPNAVVATSTAALTSAAPVARNRVAVDARALASAPVQPLAPPIVPTRQAVLGSGRVASSKPPAAVVSRPVVARKPPPPPPPTVEQRLKAIQSNGGRPLSMVQVRQIQPPPTARPAAVRVAPPPQKVIAPKAAQGAPGRPTPAQTNAAQERERALQQQQQRAQQEAQQQAAERQRAQQEAQQQAAERQRAQQAAQQAAAERQRAQQEAQQQAAERQRAQQAAQQAAAERQRAQQAAAERQRAQQAAEAAKKNEPGKKSEPPKKNPESGRPE